MKVGSMSRGKRTLLVTTTFLLAASGVHAGLWRSKKPQPSTQVAPVATVMSLTAVEAELSLIDKREALNDQRKLELQQFAMFQYATGGTWAWIQ